MPGDTAEIPRMTAAAFLAWEREQAERHEFYRGEVFAMAGGSPRHNALCANATAALVAAVKGGPCRALGADQRIGVREGEHYVYADASVVCGPLRLEAGTTDVLANPAVVVDVLSKSTEAYDRGLKWERYQSSPSLADYLMVSQTSARIEHFQRDSDGTWRYRVTGAGERVLLSSGAAIAVDDVFAGVFEVEAG